VPSDRHPIADWLNLPENTPTLNLWSTLHDGSLLAVKSDLLARTVTLGFDVGYVRNFHRLPEETRFVITVTGVESARALRNVPWPGGCSIREGMSRIEEEAVIAEYQRKWREESQSWAEFEQMTGDGIEVSSAVLGRGSEAVALHLGLLVGVGSSYVDVYIRGQGIVFQIDERGVTPEEFVAIGEAYWHAFAKRKTKD